DRLRLPLDGGAARRAVEVLTAHRRHARGSRAPSTVCQCSATWSRRPGTIRTVALDMVASLGRVLQQAARAGHAVRREAVAGEGLVGRAVELAQPVDAARL